MTGKQPSPSAYKMADEIIWGYWPNVQEIVKEIAEKTKMPYGQVAMKLESALCRKAAWMLEGSGCA